MNLLFKKPRSKYTINIFEKEDLLYINYMEKGFDVPTKTTVVIVKDLDQWVKHFSEIGWVQQKKDTN